MFYTRLTARIDLWLIALLWCISLIIINPFGDFPLNDDWSYALTVKHLFETGDFRPTGWTSMPLIMQAIWGSLFCIPLGFSFDALRLSTLVLSLLGVLGAYQLVQELHHSRWLAAIVALTLAFNPVYFALSNTFMTDVPFTAIAILAVFFFVRNLRTGSNFDLLLGTILVVAATLTRQLGIAISMAFAISLILKNGLTSRNMLRAALSPALCIGALLIFQQWLGSTDRLPALYNEPSKNLLAALVAPDMFLNFAWGVYIALLYMGWFLLPVLLFSWGCLWSKRGAHFVFLMTALVMLIPLLILWKNGFLMPQLGNIIYATGIGPLTLRDTFIMGFSHVPELPRSFWLAMTAASFLGATLLVIATGITITRLLSKLWPGKMNQDQAVNTFLLLSVIIYMIPLLIGGFYDRYLVPVTPLVAASIASLSSTLPSAQPARISAMFRLFIGSVLVGFFVFAVCSTRDYLAWNRVRWVILNDLIKNKHISPEEVDGGFEFNGLYLYDPLYTSENGKSWWWVRNDKYLVAFGPITGYSVIQKYSYIQWLPPQSGSIVLLEKNQGSGVE